VWKWLKAVGPGIALFLFLLVPLYAVSIAFGIRTGIFDLRDRTIGDEEFKALWAFIASGLATAATIIGLLLTRSHNNRTLALQQDIENQKLIAQKEADERNALLQKEASARLTLDTVVKSLDLLVMNDGKYAPKARVAGALAALVHLEHPVIAMRSLSAAWDDNAVDAATACWLISGVFDQGTEDGKYEAAVLLLLHVSDLCADDAHKGIFEWPSFIYLRWPMSIPREARYVNLIALTELILSRSQDWWGQSPGIAMLMLHEIRQTDDDHEIRDTAAAFLKALLPILEDMDETYNWSISGNRVTLTDIRGGASQHLISSGMTQDAYTLRDDLSAWAQGSMTRPSSGKSWAASPPSHHPGVA
jgi:hypothetical protein